MGRNLAVLLRDHAACCTLAGSGRGRLLTTMSLTNRPVCLLRPTPASPLLVKVNDAGQGQPPRATCQPPPAAAVCRQPTPAVRNELALQASLRTIMTRSLVAAPDAPWVKLLVQFARGQRPQHPTSIDRTRFANKRRGNNGGDCREKRRPGDACSDTAIVAANIVADSWALLSLGCTLEGRRPDAGCRAERAGAGTDHLSRWPCPRSCRQSGA